MRYIIIFLWMVLGLGYYILANNCNQISNEVINNTKPKDQKEIGGNISVIKTPCPKIGTYSFKRNSVNLLINDQWVNYKDSLLRLLTKDKKIQIVGLYVEGETSTLHNDIGMARARSIADQLAINDENLQIYSSNIGKVNFNADCDLPGAKIKLVTVTEKIREIQDRTLIYFPYNSTNKLNDREVEAYLDELALQVNKTNERIRLTGHTDNKGEPDYNIELGQSRAEVIKSYLMSKGVSSENILALSSGETLPISDNTTENGRAQNRRTELEIIK